MATNAVKIGIVGAGGVAEACHLPVLAQMPGVEIAWLCDQVSERAGKLARAWGIKRAGVEVGVGLMRRFFRSTSVARRALSTQAFGPVIEVWAAEAAHMGTTGREGSWYQADRAAAGGGVLIETGSHTVDQVFQVLGVESFDGVRAAFTNAGDIDLEARAVANVKRAGAAGTVPVHFVVSRLRDLYTGVVIRCEHASIRFGADAARPVEVLGPDDGPLCTLQGTDGGTNFYQPFYLEWRAFLEQCRSRVPSLVDAASALLGTRFIDAAYACASR